MQKRLGWFEWNCTELAVIPKSNTAILTFRFFPPIQENGCFYDVITTKSFIFVSVRLLMHCSLRIYCSLHSPPEETTPPNPKRFNKSRIWRGQPKRTNEVAIELRLCVVVHPWYYNMDSNIFRLPIRYINKRIMCSVWVYSGSWQWCKWSGRGCCTQCSSVGWLHVSADAALDSAELSTCCDTVADTNAGTFCPPLAPTVL